MRYLTIVLFTFFCNLTFAQVKSDLSFLNKTKLNQISKATKFGYKTNYNGINYRVLYVVNGDHKDWHIEFENENDYSLSFEFTIGNENTYLKKSNWLYIELKPKETKIIPLYYNLNNNNSYYAYVSIGAIRKENNDKYEFGRIDLAEIGTNVLCSYCALFAKEDFRCPVGDIDMESIDYNTDTYVGDEYTETELGKIKGTTPLSKGDKDTKEDIAYTTTATAALGGMVLIKDAYTNKVSSGKLFIGLGLEQIPLITNKNNSYAPKASYSDKTIHPSILMGLNLEFLNNKPVNIKVGAGFSYGLEAFKSGISGGHVQYNFKGGAQFWYKTQTQIKLFADFEYGGRLGSIVIDEDSINNGATATDDVREGEYDYKYIKFGFGPMWHHRDDGKETWIRPGIYFERLSFTKRMGLVKSYSISTNIQSFIILDFSYARNYPVAGTISYPNAFEFKNQHFFSIRVIRQGKMW